jgi:subtilisin family serine protease
MNEKQDNQLNMALEISDEQLERAGELAVGFNSADDSWDLIVRYNGSLEKVKEFANRVKELNYGYGIVNVNRMFVDRLADVEEIIYVEKPNSLKFAVLNGKRDSCVNQVQVSGSSQLFGEGVLVGIVDSGIDYTNDAFIDAEGNTRIYKLWDQVSDKVYGEEDINQALKSPNPYQVVKSRDISGHGTHVAGIAAGNFATDKNNNLGIATKSRLIVVKMKTPGENSFPSTTSLMEAVDFIVNESNQINQPVAINISFGNSYGSHDGTSLLSTYLDAVVNGNRTVIVIGSGNEGDSAGHTGGVLKTEKSSSAGRISGESVNVELQVSDYEKSFGIQLWKNYADIFSVEIEAPSGIRTPVVLQENYVNKYQLANTYVNILYGTPRPYSRFQEIYISLIPVERFLDSGIWIIRIIPEQIVSGRYDLWIPNSGGLNINTRFLKPSPYTTLTIPSAADKVITVGAYNSYNDTVASFSGRGYTRENEAVKPDIVAPGVDILSASNTGGTTVKTGTSMATPFVTGSAALMMEWGITRGNDSFLYGEKEQDIFRHMIIGQIPWRAGERCV